MCTPDPRGDPLQRLEIAIHVGMAAVDDAADAVGAGGLRLLDHQIDVVGEAGRHRPALRFGERFRQRIPDRQVLVEQHRAVDRVRRDVLQQRPDDRAALATCAPGLEPSAGSSREARRALRDRPP